MVYRDDHDAALAKIRALEKKLAGRDAPAESEISRPRVAGVFFRLLFRRVGIFFAYVVGGVVATIAFFLWLGSIDHFIGCERHDYTKFVSARALLAIFVTPFFLGGIAGIVYFVRTTWAEAKDKVEK